MRGTAVLLISAVLLTGCSQGKDAVPTIAGSDPVAVVQADCGQDGVANVHLDYGKWNDDFLIGRNAVTKTIAGGEDNFEKRLSLSGDVDELPLTVTTDPTTGTCKTTITNDETGDVVMERQTAGKAVLSVKMKRTK
jgi:predicted transcriptional regulator